MLRLFQPRFHARIPAGSTSQPPPNKMCGPFHHRHFFQPASPFPPPKVMLAYMASGATSEGPGLRRRRMYGLRACPSFCPLLYQWGSENCHIRVAFNVLWRVWRRFSLQRQSGFFAAAGRYGLASSWFGCCVGGSWIGGVLVANEADVHTDLIFGISISTRKRTGVYESEKSPTLVFVTKRWYSYGGSYR